MYIIQNSTNIQYDRNTEYNTLRQRLTIVKNVLNRSLVSLTIFFSLFALTPAVVCFFLFLRLKLFWSYIHNNTFVQIDRIHPFFNKLSEIHLWIKCWMVSHFNVCMPVNIGNFPINTKKIIPNTKIKIKNKTK